jgi:hypothetical protein
MHLRAKTRLGPMSSQHFKPSCSSADHHRSSLFSFSSIPLHPWAPLGALYRLPLQATRPSNAVPPHHPAPLPLPLSSPPGSIFRCPVWRGGGGRCRGPGPWAQIPPRAVVESAAYESFWFCLRQHHQHVRLSLPTSSLMASVGNRSSFDSLQLAACECTPPPVYALLLCHLKHSSPHFAWLPPHERG